MKEFMLTTFDNPYDPFTQFDEWFHFDMEKGYNSCEYLARISRTSEELSENDFDSIACVLFAGVTNQGTLKKRYKDLVKIYHPDNMCGDERLSRAINKEYQRRKA